MRSSQFVTCIIHTSFFIDTCITQIRDKEEDKEVNFAGVIRPERAEGAKDDVKQASPNDNDKLSSASKDKRGRMNEFDYLIHRFFLFFLL